MPAATLTSKGQITVPQAVRVSLGLHAGDRIDFIAVEGGYKVVALRGDIRSLRGCLTGRRAQPVSVEEMNDAVLAEAAERNMPKPRRGKSPKGRPL